MDNKKWYQFWKSSDSPHTPNQDWNYFSKKFFLLLSVGLFIFCSWETVQLVQKVLDPEQGPLAFAAIGAFDLGIISWALVRRHAAMNSPQRVISNCMIAVDLLASGVGWVASLFLQASKRGEIGKINQGDLFGIIVGGMGAVIFLNVAAALFYHLSEPQTNHPTALPRPTYSAQVMPPVAFPQALETPTVAEVTTTKRQLPEPQISRFKNVANRPKLSTRATKK